MIRWVLGCVAVFSVGLLFASTLTGDDPTRRAPKPTPEPIVRAETSLDRLAAALRDPDLDHRIDAAVALRELGEPAISVFIDLLREGDDLGRLIAARSLGKMRAVAAPAARDLCCALNREDRVLRLAILGALTHIKSKETIPDLLALLPEADPGIVQAALKALAAIKPGTSEAALAIAALIDPDQSDTARAALAVLEVMGTASAAALPQLIAAFKSDSLVCSAIEAVEAIGPDAYTAVTELVKVIRDVERVEEIELKKRLNARRRELEDRDGGAPALAAFAPPGAFLGDSLFLTSYFGHRPEYDARRALIAIGERSVPEVLRMLRDDLSAVRDHAGEILSGIGEPALPHLLAAATDAAAAVRKEVAGALGEYAKGHPELLATLSELANDPSSSVRVRALLSLRNFGDDATPVLLGALTEKDHKIVDAALASLVRIAPREPNAVPQLVKLLGHTECTVQWHAADVLAAMGEAATSGIPALVRCLSDECRYMRMSAAEALQKLGGLSIPVLIEGLDGATPEGQRAALQLLLKQEKTSDAMLGAYARMLASRSGAVRVHAAAALTLASAQNDVLLPTLLAGLRDRNKLTRSAAAEGLRALGAEAAGSLPVILKTIEHEEQRGVERVLYADMLAAVGCHDIATLAGALSSPSWNVHYDSTEALKKIGAPAIPVLAQVATTGSPEVRGEAIAILSLTAAKAPAALEVLEAIARSKEPAIRLSAIKGLWAATHDAQSVVPRLLQLVAVEETQAKAAYLLAQIGVRAAFAVHDLRAALAKAADEGVRRHLNSAIGKIERR